MSAQLKHPAEPPVEERLARLESHVEHIQADVTEIKVDLRLNSKIDGVEQRLTLKIEGVDQRLSAKIDEVDKRLSAKIDDLDVRLSARIDEVDQRLGKKIDDLGERLGELAAAMERGFARQARWAFFLYIGMGVALLKVIAQGLKWI